jgi:hypothetical protein
VWGNWRKRRGLRTWVIFLLQAGPKNGAELMDSMERMSQGWWRPSPGSIYPLLEELAKEGVVQRGPDGRFSLRPGGISEEWGFPFARPPRTLDETVSELAATISYLEDLRGSRGSELAAARDRLRELGDRLGRLAT